MENEGLNELFYPAAGSQYGNGGIFMLCQSETGVLSGSDYYFYTPSAMAKKQLFYFTSVGHFFCDFGYRIERNEDYGNYMMFLVIKGRMKISVEGEESIVKEGDMALLNCHEPHKYYSDGMAEFLWIHFDGSNTAQIYEDILEKLEGRHFFRPEDTEKIEDKFREIISRCRYGKFSSELDDSLNIYELLIMAYKKTQPQSVVDAIINIYIFAPIIVWVLVLLITGVYRLDKKYAGIMEDLREREAHGEM